MAQYKDFPQGEFDPELFDKLLNGPLTNRAVHRPASLCPCYDQTLGGPEHNCPVCKGLGYYWAEPAILAYEATLVQGSTYASRRRLPHADVRAITSVSGDDGIDYAGVTVGGNNELVFTGTPPEDGTTLTVAYTAPAQGRVHAQGFRANRNWVDRGEVVLGDVECSIPRHYEDLETPNPMWYASEHDRVLFPDLERLEQQRMVRGRNETLTYARVHRIELVTSRPAGSIVVHDPSQYTVGTDGKLTWAANQGPAAGQPYAVRYVAAPEYFVFQELPQLRHTDGAELPRRVGLRLFESYPRRAR